MANDSLQDWFEDITIEKKSKEQIEIKIPEKKITLPLTGYEVLGILTLKLEDGRSVEVLSLSNPGSLKIKVVS